MRKDVKKLLTDNTRLSEELHELEDAHIDACGQALSWKKLWHNAMASNLNLLTRLAAYEPITQVCQLLACKHYLLGQLQGLSDDSICMLA